MRVKHICNSIRASNNGLLKDIAHYIGYGVIVSLCMAFTSVVLAEVEQSLTTKALQNGALKQSTLEPLRVVVTIRPLALMLEELLGDRISTHTLVPANASPHHYSLKASDVTALNVADYVVWLGPELEQFMTKLVANLPEKRTITLSNPSFGAPSPGNPSPDSQAVEADHDHEHNHIDNHQWLDPAAVRVMAKHIVAQMSAVDTDLAGELASKQQQFVTDLQALEVQLQSEFSEVRDSPFVVYHRGYDALVEHFGLYQLGWVTINPEYSPSVRHLVELQQSINKVSADKPVKCLFYEASSSEKSAHRVAGQLNLEAVELDILGAHANTTSYSAMMVALVSAMKACLK